MIFMAGTGGAESDERCGMEAINKVVGQNEQK